MIHHSNFFEMLDTLNPYSIDTEDKYIQRSEIYTVHNKFSTTYPY